MELKSLLQGLDQRLTQLSKDVLILEKEDDRGLYGVLSLYLIENEMNEIKQLIDKLDSITQEHQILAASATRQVHSQPHAAKRWHHPEVYIYYYVFTILYYRWC